MAGFQTVLSEWSRMCNALDCDRCAIGMITSNIMGVTCTQWVIEHPAKAEALVMQWAKAHPVKDADPYTDSNKQKGLLLKQYILDENCTDCSEYNIERHCCPRWNQVIRRTIEELKANAQLDPWTPFNGENFPETDRAVYLVTDKGGLIQRLPFYNTETGRGIWRLNVKAYMPQPKPWKGAM